MAVASRFGPDDSGFGRPADPGVGDTAQDDDPGASPATATSAAVTFSTDCLPARERFDFWRTVAFQQYDELQLHPLGAVENFAGSMTSILAGPVRLSRINAESVPHLGEQTSRAVTRAGQHYFVVTVVLDGAGVVVQDDRSAILAPGDFVLYDTSRPFTMQFERDFGVCHVQIPEKLMRTVFPQAPAATAITVGRGESAASLVRQLCDNLFRSAGTASPSLQRHLTAATIELVAASLADRTSTPVSAPLRAAHFVRAREYVEQNLWDSDLSPELIARAVLISPRYLRALFRENGISVSRYVIERRLDCAFRDLTDPRRAHLPVADIATGLGFKSASHFTKAFKARFGLGPREHRSGARHPEASAEPAPRTPYHAPPTPQGPDHLVR